MGLDEKSASREIRGREESSIQQRRRSQNLGVRRLLSHPRVSRLYSAIGSTAANGGEEHETPGVKLNVACG